MPRGVPMREPRYKGPLIQRYQNMDPSHVKGWLKHYMYHNQINIPMLARRMDASEGYLRTLLTTTRKYIVSSMLDRICDALALTADDRQHVHKLAAESWGFRVLDHHYEILRAAEELKFPLLPTPSLGRAQVGKKIEPLYRRGAPT